MTTARETRGRGPRALVLVATLVATSLLFSTWRLGIRPLVDWDEALSGGRASEIIRTGDWLTIRFNREPDFHKPPLYYWLIASAYEFGGIDEFTTRLPNGFGAAALVWIVFGLGARLAGWRAGYLSGAFLLTVPLFIDRTRHAHPDLILYPATIGAVLAFVTERHLLMGVLVAAAVLTKGIAGVLGLLFVLGWSILTVDFRLIGRPRFLGGVTVAVLLAVPWFVWSFLSYPEDFREVYAGHETVNRIFWAAPWGPLGHYYFRVLQDSFGPLLWVLPAWPLALSIRLLSGRSWCREAFVPASILVGILVLSITHPMNGHYALVLSVPLALAGGTTVATFVELKQPWNWILTLGLVAMTVVGAEQLLAVRPTPPLLVGLGAFAVGWALLFRPSSLRTAPVLIVLLVLAANAAGNLGIPKPGQTNRGLQVISPEIQDLVPDDEILFSDEVDVKGEVFYSQRRVEKIKGLFFRNEPPPERIFGVFTSGLWSGIAGYRSEVLARHNSTRLVELVRDPEAGVPEGPRLIGHGNDPGLENALRLLGCDVRKFTRNGYSTYVAVETPPVLGRPLRREGWRLTSEDSASAPATALDGDLDTAWAIGINQEPGMSFTLDLRRMTLVTGIRLTTNHPRGFAHGLEIESSRDGEAWSGLVRVGRFHPGFSLEETGLAYHRDYGVEARWPEQRIRFLRLTITEGTERMGWRITEIDVLGTEGRERVNGNAVASKERPEHRRSLPAGMHGTRFGAGPR